MKSIGIKRFKLIYLKFLGINININQELVIESWNIDLKFLINAIGTWKLKISEVINRETLLENNVRNRENLQLHNYN